MIEAVPVAVGLLAGAAWYLALAAYVRRCRGIPGATALMGMLASVGVWTLCYAAELCSRDIDAARWWSGLKFVGIVGLVPALWAFVVRYTDAERVVPRVVLGLLAIEPVTVLTLLAVPATHDLIHSYPGGSEQRYAPYPVPETGPLFWPHAVYTYLLMFAAIGVLVVRLSRITGGYRRAAQAITAATLLPLAGNIVYNTGLGGLDTLDPTPFLFTVTVSVLVWGFFRFRLVQLLPVARTAVLERLTDAVIVVDGFTRVLDVNPAACRLLGRSRAAATGIPLADLVPPLAELVDSVTPLPAVERVPAHEPGRERRVPWGDEEMLSSLDLRLVLGGDSGLGRPGDPVVCDVAVTVTALRDGGPGPRAVVVRDVTARRRAERRLRELLRQQTQLAQTLQQALRPAALPPVPGVALAARSLPSGQSDDDGGFSGDFYDVHRAGEGRWAFVLGDVSGKGVHAAVVTALTRYTVRTLSAEGRTPSEVVLGLNRALQAEDDALPGDGERFGERFCTLVYGHVQSDPDGSLLVTLVLAGHPQPLVRRADGRVEEVGEPGTVLGLLPEIDVRESQVRLAPGDVLVMFTDGVTEARRAPGSAAVQDRSADGEQFGDALLAQVVAAASGEVTGVVGDVLRAVVSYADERDDIAVLALAPRR